MTVSRRGSIVFGGRFHFEVHLLLLPLIACAYFGGYLHLFAVSWGSALAHEFCHILAGRRLGISVSGIAFLPFGVCAPLRNPVIKEPVKEILMALAGPMCNLMFALLLHLLEIAYPSDLLHHGVMVNLAMCALNLLPCLPLDGGRVLRALLTLGSDTLTAHRVSVGISRVLSCLLLGTGILLLLTARFNFSLLLIGVFLLGNLCTEQKNVTRQTLEELLYYKRKLEPETLNRTVVLTAYADLPARRLLRRLSYHRYCIIKVVDHNQKVVQTLTEGQVLHALLHGSIRITLGEIKI